MAKKQENTTPKKPRRLELPAPLAIALASNRSEFTEVMAKEILAGNAVLDPPMQSSLCRLVGDLMDELRALKDRERKMVEASLVVIGAINEMAEKLPNATTGLQKLVDAIIAADTD